MTTKKTHKSVGLNLVLRAEIFNDGLTDPLHNLTEIMLEIYIKLERYNVLLVESLSDITLVYEW